MDLKFNINRPKVSDDEINKHQDFDKLVRQFKEQSIKKARGDESWWRNKKIRYTAVIAGVTVVCTITYLSLFNNQQQSKETAKNDKITTSSTKNTSTEKNETGSSQSHDNSAPATTKIVAAKKPFVAAPSQKLKTPYAS